MSKSALKKYLTELGSKGGLRKTDAQTEARKANMAKARKARLTKREDAK